MAKEENLPEDLLELIKRAGQDQKAQKKEEKEKKGERQNG